MSTSDSSGVSMDRYADVLAEMITLAEAWKGSSISTDEKELLGHLLRQVAAQVHTVNEAIQSVYDSIGVANNTGVSLDNALELIGMERLSASKSTATLTITVSRAVTIPAGFKRKTSTGVTFETLSALVFPTAGSSDALAECTEYGPYEAGVGEITEAVTSNAAVTEVTNAAAAVPGRSRETDAECKLRHTLETASTGERSINTVHAAVAGVLGCSSVYSYENTTDAVADGVPPQHIHIVVIGGSDEAIANAIADNKSEGTGTYGAEEVASYNVVTGQADSICFDRGTDVDCYISMALTKNGALYPDDGDAQIKAALLALFSGFKLNGDVSYHSLSGPITSVPGHIINSLYLGITPSPTGTSSLTISNTQRAVLDIANVIIT